MKQPARKKGPKPLPRHEKRRIAVRIWLTEAEYAAVKTLSNISAIGRASLLAAAGQALEMNASSARG